MYEKIGVLSTLFMFFYSGLKKLISKIQRNSDSERMIKILPAIQEYAIPLIVLVGILEVAAVAFIVRDVLSDGVLDDPYSLYALMSLIVFTIVVTIYFYANPVVGFKTLPVLSNMTTLGSLALCMSLIMNRKIRKAI